MLEEFSKTYKNQKARKTPLHFKGVKTNCIPSWESRGFLGWVGDGVS